MLKILFIMLNKFNNILLNTYNYKLLCINFLFFLKKKKIFLFVFFLKKKTKIFLVFKNNKKRKKIIKKSKIGRTKEIKLNLNIHIKDYDLKIKKTIFFLKEGYTVKLSVFFKGREIVFKEKGVELILNFQNNIKGVLFKFSDIEFEGKHIYSVIIPKIKNENKKKNYKKF
ncbi:hypothetical protein ACJEC8_00690 [Candidatus Carsonella ruddii]|uniref:hypothetical protein n=1 Tax=Carsonella ruddii TaxID=114186 RepID=UPI003D52E282